MSDELNEQQDASNLDVEETTTETTDTDFEVDVEALKAKADKADEYKKYADRVAAENKKLKEKPEPKINSSEDSRFERLELKTDGYNSEEVDFLMQNGGKTALDNQIVVAGIEAIRKKNKSSDATPTGTNKSPMYKKYTEQDLKNMPLSELEKIIPQ